jgi:ribosomal protein L12E/L44/L45/RPP1/RPP2
VLRGSDGHRRRRCTAARGSHDGRARNGRKEKDEEEEEEEEKEEEKEEGKW